MLPRDRANFETKALETVHCKPNWQKSEPECPHEPGATVLATIAMSGEGGNRAAENRHLAARASWESFLVSPKQCANNDTCEGGAFPMFCSSNRRFLDGDLLPRSASWGRSICVSYLGRVDRTRPQWLSMS